MLGSLGIAASIYVLVAIVLTGVVPYTELNVADPLSVGLRAVGHPGGRLIVEAGALAGLTSVLLLQLFGQTRILLAMARDGLLPASLTALHPVHQTPVRLTYWVGGLAALAAGCLPLDLLGELSSVGTLLAFMGVAGAVVQMRRQRPDWPRPFRIPGGNFLLPGFSLGISGLLLCTATAGSQWRLAAWLGLGLLIYARQASCGARPDPRASVNS
jgi:APA family basic amino acid/polyamine antiporter